MMDKTAEQANTVDNMSLKAKIELTF